MESRNEMQNLLIRASNLLKELESLIKRQEELQKKILPTEGGYSKLWHGMHPVGIKILIAFVLLLILDIFGGLTTMIAQLFYFNFGFSESVSIGLVWVLKVVVIAVALVLIQECVNKMIVSKNQKNANQLECNKQRNIQIQQQLAEVQNRLAGVGQRYAAECAEYIPATYRYNVNAVTYFASAFADGRADTLKEAINVYETDQHRKRLEEKYDKIHEEQIRHNLTSEFIAVKAVMDHNAAMNRQTAAIQQAGRDISNSIRGY